MRHRDGIEDDIKRVPGNIGGEKKKKKRKKEREKGGKSGRCGVFTGHDFNPRASVRKRSLMHVDLKKNGAPKLRYAKAVIYLRLLFASTIRVAFITTDDGSDRICGWWLCWNSWQLTHGLRACVHFTGGRIRWIKCSMILWIFTLITNSSRWISSREFSQARSLERARCDYLGDLMRIYLPCESLM